MKAKKGPADFICNICNLKLSRSSHLVRHRLVHSSTSSENFPCDKCNKSYSRKDVLLRHMRTAHSAAKTRRQSTKSTTPRKSVTCAHCLQPDLKCNGQTPCLPCRKHQTLCSTNAAQATNSQPKSPVVKQEETLERHLSTASSSSLPPDEATNGFETEPSDVSILSAREDHDHPKKAKEDYSLIDPRLRGGDNATFVSADGILNHPAAGGEPGAESPYDSSSQVHHDDWQHGVPPPYPFASSETTWNHGHGYQSDFNFERMYAHQPPDSIVDFEAVENPETIW